MTTKIQNISEAVAVEIINGPNLNQLRVSVRGNNIVTFSIECRSGPFTGNSFKNKAFTLWKIKKLEEDGLPDNTVELRVQSLDLRYKMCLQYNCYDRKGAGFLAPV